MPGWTADAGLVMMRDTMRLSAPEYFKVISLWACSPCPENTLARGATADHCLTMLRTLALTTGDENEGEMSAYAGRLGDLAAQFRDSAVPDILMMRARPGAQGREDRDERRAVTIETDSDV